MKITAVEPILLSAPLADGLVRWSGGSFQVANACLVRVHTDEGITGLGDTYGGGLFAPEAARSVVEHFADMVTGDDATNIAGIWQRLYSQTIFWGRTGLVLSVLSALEMALWDLNAKALGVPVYRMLGGLAHDRLPVYASGGLDQSDADFVAELEQYAAAGFDAVKVRIGHGARADGQRVALARRTVGPDFKLMVDAVQGHNPNPWHAGDAVVVARALADFDLTWFEEPCAATDYEGYAAVRAKAAMPIAGGESSATIHDFKQFFERRALDIAQPDAAHCGGILEFQRIAALADAVGARVVPHAWGSGPALVSNYHVAFATAACFMVEYPTISNPLRQELLVEPLAMRDGYLLPPTAPGLGLELTQSTIDRYPFQPGSAVKMGQPSLAAAATGQSPFDSAFQRG